MFSDGTIPTSLTPDEKVIDIPWQAPESFTLFSRLPIEIQRQIWEEALPEPRVVQLCFDESLGLDDDLTFNGNFSFDNNVPSEGRSPSGPCAVLEPASSRLREEHHMTCKEAYSVFFDNYQRIGMNPKYDGMGFIQKINISYPMFIDSRRDTLTLDVDELEQNKDQLDALLESVPHIRNLAVTRRNQENTTEEVDVLHWQRIFPRLKNLTVVIGFSLYPNQATHAEGIVQLIEPDSNLRNMELHVCGASPTQDPEQQTNCNTCWNAGFEWLNYGKGAFSMEEYFKDFIRHATRLKEAHEPERKNDARRFRSLNFKAALMVFKENVNRYPPTEQVWIAPMTESPSGVRQIYRTQRPVPPSDDGLMWFQDINCYGSCRRDGTLDCPYDGMKEMFEEGPVGVQYRENVGVPQNPYKWEFYNHLRLKNMEESGHSDRGRIFEEYED